jgi:hypothetical protein
MTSLHLSSDLFEVYKRLSRSWTSKKQEEHHDPIDDSAHEDDKD